MLKKILLSVILLFGLVLITINIYGLFQDVRPQRIDNEHLRFINDHPLAYKNTLAQLTKQDHENDITYASRVTGVISKGIAHIHWDRYDAEQFNQTVPIWENYFLYFMGKFSGIPEYKKYHFANYKRSLARGIGVCGDTSMILSQVLNEHDIENKILTFPGHVVVEAKFSDNTRHVLDADFGVVIPLAANDFKGNGGKVANLYLEAGYTKIDADFARNMSQGSFQRWDGVKHFITNKYYFEKVAYFLKWPLPILMVLFGMFGWYSLNRKCRTEVRPT